MKKRVAIIPTILIVLMMACSLSSKTGTTPQAQPGLPGLNSSPDPNPVSINEGLGSLNSYQMTITIASTGPDPSQSSNTTVETQRSKENDATYTHMTMTSIPAGGGDPSNNDTELYRIGNDQCSGSGEDWTWTSNTPAETEMLSVIKSMIGITPLFDNPSFVGEETINDIPTNHFSFQLSGLGVKSGANVNINQGDYWLAKDGQYIVKYVLILETSTEADANILHEEISIELTQINQPIDIAFPQACLDASVPTPTP